MFDSIEYNLKAKEAAAAAITSAKEGEHVLDLGTGKGDNVFLAASLVGSEGQVAGLVASEVDLVSALREAASRNLTYPQVSFVQATFKDALPVTSESVDYIVSSSVISSLPISGKDWLLEEMFRVLRPGGRICINDVSATGGLQGSGNIISVEQYEQLLANAGFQDISFVPNGANSISVSLCQVRASKPGSPPPDTSAPKMIHYWLEASGPLVRSPPPPRLTAEEVAALIDEGENIAIVDVRREARPDGFVRGSHNLPAQTFYLNLPRMFSQFKDTEKVIFYCNSSAGRGPRCAGWYQDYLDSIGEEHRSKAYVLHGGAKAWVAKFGDREDLVAHE